MTSAGVGVGGVPATDCRIDVALVRRLVCAQHPDLAHHAILRADRGWDNQLFRLGSDLVVRMPRRAAACGLLLNERRWLAEISAGLPLRTPVPLRSGRPAAGYPYEWSITPWLSGTPADLAGPIDEAQAMLARFLQALHRPAAPGAPSNPVRGCPLSARAAAMQSRLARLDEQAVMPRRLLRGLWEHALSADTEQQRCWIHGDLHPQNILVDGGRITAVLDWGDLAEGDRATDLAAVWMLLSQVQERARALALYGVSSHALRRAKGWALIFAGLFIEAGRERRLLRLGRKILGNLLAGP